MLPLNDAAPIASKEVLRPHSGECRTGKAFTKIAALVDLVAHAGFEQAHSIFELGCGTGGFASSLLSKHLPRTATYLGIDIANERISPYAECARLALSGGPMSFPITDNSVDRVVSTYVLDLLSEQDIRQAISEAHRTLRVNGKLCLVSLTEGDAFASRVVSKVWSTLFSAYAPLVGGCRPVGLESFIDRQSSGTRQRDYSVRCRIGGSHSGAFARI